MVIIGIDPGIARCGWGVVSKAGSNPVFMDYGCVETEKGLAHGERLQMIYNDLSKILDEYKPSLLVLEKLFFSKNVTTAMNVSETRGVIVLLAHQKGIPIHELTPNQIKSSVTGSGNADKAQVQKMVKLLLKMDHIPQPDDAADALAGAISGAFMPKLGLL